MTMILTLATQSACEPVGNSEYVFSLTAFDESGNESAPAIKPHDKKAQANLVGDDYGDGEYSINSGIVNSCGG